MCTVIESGEEIPLDGWRRAVIFNYIIYFVLSIQCGYAIFATFLTNLRKSAKIISAITTPFHITAIIWLYVVGFSESAKLCTEQDTGELG